LEEYLRSLLVRGLAGDGPAAYRIFLSKLAAHLRSFLRKRLPRLPEEVEDLVQESLLAIHNQRHTYDPKQPLTPWVQAIARYKLIDLVRRRARRETLHDPVDEDDELLVGQDTAAAEGRYDVARLLEQLPDRQRFPIQYVKIEGASLADTAARTGMSISAVKVGIHLLAAPPFAAFVWQLRSHAHRKDTLKRLAEPFAILQRWKVFGGVLSPFG
jgi:RNA polymerase sigma-70 factor (ECF subfamily)